MRTQSAISSRPLLFLSPRCRRRRCDGGYTFVELLVVLVLLSIVTLMVLLGSRRLQVQHNALSSLTAVSALHEFGRLEAVKRHSQVGVMFSTEARAITLFEDRNRGDETAAGNGNGALDSGESILRTVSIGRALAFSRPDGGNPVDIGGSTLLYGSDGSLRPVGVQAPAIYFTDSKDNHLRLRVNRITGGVTIEKSVGNDIWTARSERWVWKY